MAATSNPALLWKQELIGLLNLLASEHMTSDEAIRWWDRKNGALGSRSPATVVMEAVHPFQEDIALLLKSIGGSHVGLHHNSEDGS